MVVGHSGCPRIIEKVIYSFHMPFFFICSGYFFSPKFAVDKLVTFGVKKIKGLYLQFIKWCLPFILLHNVFYNLNLYNNQFGYKGEVSHLFTINDYIRNIIDNVTSMKSIPQLLGGFWFISYLFYAAIFIAFITFIVRKDKCIIRLLLFLLLFCSSLFFSYIPVGLHFISARDLFWSSTFFFTGYLLKQIRIEGRLMMLCLILFMVGNMMPYYTEFFTEGKLMILFFVTSVSGTLLVFGLSKIFEKNTCFRDLLYYMGNHTLVILGLHFLVFNIVDLIIIISEGLPITHLAEFPVIANHQSYWILYTLFGVIIPLMIGWLYNRIRELLRC